ncbi:MAG: T9SS type A sorting domain-containing protein [Raineya sp.]|nr:T9SS type A sorting domain-containing protein [Raineya sp.]
MRLISTLILLLFSYNVIAQGKLLLVGGGSEKQGGWSDTPYQWAINQSVNKKVAIVSYQSQDDWLKNYFVSLGATQATNYTISTRTDADLQATYDNLMACDVIFFKGGDQTQYYLLYKGTKVEQAIEDKFAGGGVVGGTSAGMAILSKIFFSAENGAFYPADGLESINSPYFSLKNDFIDIFPEFIFDTHFIERGRNTRLMALMAKWFQQTGNLVKGIGVDDQTALCINATKQATCYGTGATHIYAGNNFSFFNNKITADDITAKILVHNHQIDLTNLNILQGGSESFNPLINQEDGNYKVFLSGGEGLADNMPFIKDFVLTANSSDEIILVTGTDTTIAAQYKQQMKAEGANKITILQAITANNQDDKYPLRNAIKQSKKVFFVNIVSYSLFSQFLAGQTGQLLNKHIRRNQIVNAFVGDNSKLAGKVYVNNNRSSQYNAYDGNLAFSNGLNLLKTTTILPNAFNPDDNNFFENNSCAVSYAVAQSKLKFGIYINKKSWVKFTQNTNQNVWSAGGQYVSTILHNTGTQGTFTTQIASSSSNKPRNIVGFSQIKYIMLNNNVLQAGTPVTTTDETYQLETSPNPTSVNNFYTKMPQVFPNPAQDFLEIVWKDEDFKILIYDSMGKLVQNTQASHQMRMNLQTLKKGVYTIQLISKKTQNIINRQIVIL